MPRPLAQSLPRYLLVALLATLGLGACTVVPAPPHHGYYHDRPSVVYGGRTDIYYDRYDDHHDRRHRHDYRNRHDHRDHGYRPPNPLEQAARAHRDIRRSLGLPRLPGMP